MNVVYQYVALYLLAAFCRLLIILLKNVQMHSLLSG